MMKKFTLMLIAVLSLAACKKAEECIFPTTVSIPAEQYANMQESYEMEQITGGLCLNFQISGITHIELESVDGYALAGTGTIVTVNGQKNISEISDPQSIITFRATANGTLVAGKDYYITTFPCDVYGGYRLSIYKDGLVAHFFGVHQQFEAGNYIAPFDLVESELDFVDPAEPLVEDERPGLSPATHQALVRYRQNPTAENRELLLEQMGIRYDKVVARKKAKLRQLEREAHDQHLIDEMQAIVDEMVANRDVRIWQQFLRLIDPREDEDPNDAWMVLRGSTGNNAYIGYTPVTNAEYAACQISFTYPANHGNYPVVNITYSEAVAYCGWLTNHDPAHSYRLPSEEEWILAAGHMPKDVAMNSNHVHNGLTPVDAYAQTTGACGGVDFWGNCWEWTSTQNNQGWYIVKGGSWNSSRDACRTEYSGEARNGIQPYSDVGFRVVREDR